MLFFFFKQKTAYEMRISDWSSDVCSSDLNVPEDPHCGLADKAEIARGFPVLDMLDDAEPSTDTIKERARACEEAALAVTGVTHSEGAEAGWHRSTVTLYASNGFAGPYALSQLGRATCREGVCPYV